MRYQMTSAAQFIMLDPTSQRHCCPLGLSTRLEATTTNFYVWFDTDILRHPETGKRIQRNMGSYVPTLFRQSSVVLVHALCKALIHGTPVLKSHPKDLVRRGIILTTPGVVVEHVSTQPPPSVV